MTTRSLLLFFLLSTASAHGFEDNIAGKKVSGGSFGEVPDHPFNASLVEKLSATNWPDVSSPYMTLVLFYGHDENGSPLVDEDSRSVLHDLSRRTPHLIFRVGAFGCSTAKPKTNADFCRQRVGPDLPRFAFESHGSMTFMRKTDTAVPTVQQLYDFAISRMPRSLLHPVSNETALQDLLAKHEQTAVMVWTDKETPSPLSYGLAYFYRRQWVFGVSRNKELAAAHGKTFSKGSHIAVFKNGKVKWYEGSMKGKDIVEWLTQYEQSPKKNHVDEVNEGRNRRRKQGERYSEASERRGRDLPEQARQITKRRRSDVEVKRRGEEDKPQKSSRRSSIFSEAASATERTTPRVHEKASGQKESQERREEMKSENEAVLSENEEIFQEVPERGLNEDLHQSEFVQQPTSREEEASTKQQSEDRNTPDNTTRERKRSSRKSSLHSMLIFVGGLVLLGFIGSKLENRDSAVNAIDNMPAKPEAEEKKETQVQQPEKQPDELKPHEDDWIKLDKEKFD